MLTQFEFNYKFYEIPVFTTILIRKVKDYFYVFVDGVFKVKKQVNAYIPGKGFSIVNEVPRVKNRNGEIFVDQLDEGNAVKVNYFRLSSLKQK